jgi:hypothetical protein
MGDEYVCEVVVTGIGHCVVHSTIEARRDLHEALCAELTSPRRNFVVVGSVGNNKHRQISRRLHHTFCALASELSALSR